MTGILEDLQRGVEEIRAANLPEYTQRLNNLEKRLKDLEYRLAPLLEIIKIRGTR